MDAFTVYKDIQARTKGQFLVGVVGPVRTGKSTFIRRFMEVLALPEMEEEKKAEIQDQLPLSGSGKLITTVEPKFIPKEAVELCLGGEVPVKLRLIDCVGFLVPDALGNLEADKERMVKTPWFDEAIPFHRAAEVGTQRVISQHSTIGLVVTCDGSFGEIPRENFVESEERTVAELKKQGKPFLILVNSQKPYREETQKLAAQLQEKYEAAVMSVNCEQLRREDITKILEKILYEFPIRQLEFYIPKWLELLPCDHEIKKEILGQIRDRMGNLRYIRDITPKSVEIEAPCVKRTVLEQIDLATGQVKIRLELENQYYFQMLSQMTGVEIRGEYDLITTLQELAAQKEEYVRVQAAMESVRGCGYGVVLPEREEVQLQEPVIIRQGSKYGVKIKAASPSIHMIKANIETEIAPVVGNEQQAKDLLDYIQENAGEDGGIWQTTIFGKTVEQLVEDGIRSKITQISEESQVKLQDTMQKIVNDSKGGLVCIII